jgi:MFS transporter, OFA family, oxalate/formate antiporter
MFIAFSLEAVAVFALLQLMNRLVWFIALSGLCFFAWSEIFSTTFTGDLFEKKRANTNYGLVYPPKDWVRSWPVPVLPGCLKRPVPGRGYSMP